MSNVSSSQNVSPHQHTTPQDQQTIEQSLRWFWRLCAVALAAFLLAAFAGTGCTDPQEGPTICHYEHECKDNERCIYDDPGCLAKLGECKGKCIAQEPIPEVKCQCQSDSDCNEPLESCLSCKCVANNVQACKVDGDCIRGWYCVGEPGKQICQRRSSCEKDEECPHGYVCRDNSCCDPQTNTCPGTCEEGNPCETDIDCYYCNMRCDNKKCTFKNTDACAGIKCTEDTDCEKCKGTCNAGYCQTTP